MMLWHDQPSGQLSRHPFEHTNPSSLGIHQPEKQLSDVVQGAPSVPVAGPSSTSVEAAASSNTVDGSVSSKPVAMSSGPAPDVSEASLELGGAAIGLFASQDSIASAISGLVTGVATSSQLAPRRPHRAKAIPLRRIR